jgi:Putative zincin peptidase
VPVETPEQPIWVFRMTSGLAARLAPLSLVLFVASVAGYALLARQSLATAPFPVLLTVVTFVLIVPVHEALHGVGFMIFGGHPKFGAGIRGGAPYFFATCPGERFSWGRTVITGVLPLVAIDVAALALAGYSPLVVPAMLAFAFNTAGAVADLWIIAVIFQTPRTASFEDTDEPAMIAWPAPGERSPAQRPHGLDPRGFESVVVWGGVAMGLFLALFAAMGFIEFALARASPNGTLAVGNVVLASVTTSNGHFSGRVSFLPALVLAALAAALTWATRTVMRRFPGKPR